MFIDKFTNIKERRVREMLDCRGVINLPNTWYKSLSRNKKEKLDKTILKEWNVQWNECSETLKSIIYYKERGK